MRPGSLPPRPLSVGTIGSIRGRVLLVLLLFASVGRAEPASLPQELKDGIEAYNQVEYQPALMYLRSALQRVKGRRLLAITYFYLGCTYLALEETAKARASFETLLAFQPDYVPNRQLTSPKIAGFLSQVRNEYPTPAALPTLAHQPPAGASRGQTRLALEVQHLSPRLRPVLHYRASTTPEFLTLEAYEVLGSVARFAMPTPSDQSTMLYYFALSTRSGITVRRLGSSKRPFRLQGEARRGSGAATPWYRRWWVWTIAGVVVAGASAGTAYALTRGADQSRVEVVIFRRDAKGTAVEVFGP